MSDNTFLREIFRKNGFELSPDVAEKLSVYSRFLREYNERVNLTAIVAPDDIAVKHFLDSIYGAKYVKSGSRLVDVGSGAGFPAVVLKLFDDSLNVTMLESNGKKVTFLKELIALLGLTDITALPIRAEDAARDTALRASFDFATARAVTALSPLAEYTIPLLKVGGRLIAYKGQEHEDATTAFAKLGASLVTEDEYILDNTYSRRLVVAEKASATPQEYPRINGKIKKFPL